MLSMAERDYDIRAHGTIGNRAFTDYGRGVLAERWFLEPFSRDDWSGGFAAFLDGCEEYLRMDAEGAPFDQGTDPERLGDLAVVMAGRDPRAAADGARRLPRHEGKMKSARLRTQADAYITQDSLRSPSGRPLHHHHPDPRQDRDRQSGGTSVNSGGFSHSSGKFLKKSLFSSGNRLFHIYFCAAFFLPPRWCPCCRGRRRGCRTDIP